MTSHYVMVTKKQYLVDRHNEYIVLCKFESHTISGCRVTGVGPPKPPPPPTSPRKQKKSGLNIVKDQKSADAVRKDLSKKIENFIINIVLLYIITFQKQTYLF